MKDDRINDHASMNDNMRPSSVDPNQNVELWENAFLISLIQIMDFSLLVNNQLIPILHTPKIMF